MVLLAGLYFEKDPESDHGLIILFTNLRVMPGVQIIINKIVSDITKNPDTCQKIIG